MKIELSDYILEINKEDENRLNKVISLLKTKNTNLPEDLYAKGKDTNKGNLIYFTDTPIMLAMYYHSQEVKGDIFFISPLFGYLSCSIYGEERALVKFIREFYFIVNKYPDIIAKTEISPHKNEIISVYLKDTTTALALNTIEKLITGEKNPTFIPLFIKMRQLLIDYPGRETVEIVTNMLSKDKV